MKKNRNRLLSLLLALAMMLSLANGAVLAAESEDFSPAPAQEDVTDPAEPETDQNSRDEGESEDPAPDENEEAEPGDDEASEEATPEGDGSTPAEAEATEETQTEEAEQAEAEEEEEAELETQSTSFNVLETVSLELEYDDHFSFSEVKKGYAVAKIEDEEIVSYKVERGKKTGTRDKHLITLNSGSDTDAVATATGTATVMLVDEDDLDTTGTVDAIQVDVTVSPAPLTIMLLGGQSNMEGWGSKGSGEKKGSQYQHPEDSIVCPEGEVYSTYAPGKSAKNGQRSNSIGGRVNFSGDYCKPFSLSSAKNFVPQCLTGSGSVGSYSGTKLVYPVNQLTAKGKGKNGMDSGLAYEWNRLTGDKVWTVNAAVGSSRIRDWQPGKDCYSRAYNLYGVALYVYKAEIAAKHYKPSHQLFFWLQGEHDRKTSGSKYYNGFKVMHDKLQKQLKDKVGYTFEETGIISVRASKSSKHYRDAGDLVMTGPRVVQSYLGNTKKMEDVYMVSDVNENWVSDSGVSKYFKSVYNGKLDYKTHSGKQSLPTKVSKVHNDIHYHQVAHNENGLTAARGMYEILKDTAEPKSVKWRSSSGKTVSKMNLAMGESAVISPAVSPVSASKTVKWKFSSGLSYSGTSGKVSVTKAGKQQAQCIGPDGKVISTLVVSTGKAIAAPSLKSATNVKDKKISASWSKVSGAKGYDIQCAVKSDFSGAKTLSVSGTSTTLKGLKSKKTYYVRVRSWIKDEDGKKISSKWSGKKSVKITK